MNLDHVFKKTTKGLYHTGINPSVPDDLLCKCKKCGGIVLIDDVRSGGYICPKCGGYFRMSAYERIKRVADEGTFLEWDRNLVGTDPLQFEGYEAKLAATRLRTHMKEAVITGRCRIGGRQTVLCVMDGRFFMASMGEAVGEKITRAVERATKLKLPVIIFACSGGARMQEGILSLMQMAKTSAAIKRHSEAGLLYISVLTDPTTGGVMASFAMLGDIILAEPGALAGFAGQRVIEQTIHQKLPKGFQRAEFLQEHGFVDRIVKREEMRQVLSDLLMLHHAGEENVSENISGLQDKINKLARDNSDEGRREQLQSGKAGADQKKEPSCNAKKLTYEKTAWDRVRLAREQGRSISSDYIRELFPLFYELHGDRAGTDDPAVIAGIAMFENMPVTIIAQEKGKNTKEQVAHNFGMCQPGGYRKVKRLLAEAEKFKRPVICFVDTPGAYCGIEAEEQGQGEAIATSISDMSALSVPVLSIIIGEGGSGGALALATANEVWMLENAMYSILSPEGFASILWKDSHRAKEAAACMKLTAEDLLGLGVIEKVFAEEEKMPEGLPKLTAELSKEIGFFLQKYEGINPEQVKEMRYERFRKIGNLQL
ncbi:MAG: acetyl-CoA carboxylase, carboxyltransferase subunit beta [Lachnospiraceae bacterium]|nr:acetyl-CoA carboxylase, carboxyltransferase subunit beta [Lachnospiraceae bacterium]